MSASKVAGALAAAVRGEVKEKLMEKIWSKHAVAFKIASLALPVIVIIWAIRIDCVPVAILGSLCLLAAHTILKRQEKQNKKQNHG